MAYTAHKRTQENYADNRYKKCNLEIDPKQKMEMTSYIPYSFVSVVQLQSRIFTIYNQVLLRSLLYFHQDVIVFSTFFFLCLQKYQNRYEEYSFNHDWGGVYLILSNYTRTYKPKQHHEFDLLTIKLNHNRLQNYHTQLFGTEKE